MVALILGQQKVQVTATGFELTSLLVCKQTLSHLGKLAKKQFG